MKYLLFNEQATTADIGAAAHDVAMYPASSFLGFTNEATTETEITMFFKSMEALNDIDATSTDKVVLTITINRYVDVMKAITQAMHATGPGYTDGVLTIFDAESGASVSSLVTGCAITVQAAD